MSNMVVQTNVLALNAHRNMKGVGGMQEKASSRLASGFRINSAADDAAGLAISEKMRSQIRGLDMASKNSQDAISLIQTAEGGMQEIDNMIQRIRELVVYAANDTNDPDNGGTDAGKFSGIQAGDRQKIQDEINSLMKEIDSMAGRVEFNKKTLIDGSFEANKLQLTEGLKLQDAQATASVRDDIASANLVAVTALRNAASTAIVTGVGLGVGATNSGILSGAASAALSAAQVTLPTATIASAVAFSAASAQLTTLLNTLSTATNAAAFDDVVAGLNSLINKIGAADNSDADKAAAAELRKFMNGSVMEQLKKDYSSFINNSLAFIEATATKSTTLSTYTAATSVYTEFSNANPTWDTATTPQQGNIYFQVGANANQGWSLNIGNITCKGLGLAGGAIREDGVVEGRQGNIDPNSYINVLRMTGEGELTSLLDTMDQALTVVTTERSKLGAAQNRLEYTIKSLDISSENLSASESRIRDTDMAKEMMQLTKSNVLQQSTISILSQANQNPMSLMALLR